MTTLAAGASVTFGLSVDQTFELTTTDGTTGTISLDGPFGSPMRWSFGPARQNNWKPVSKGLSGALTLTCTAGSVSYTVGSSVFVTATDANGNTQLVVGTEVFAISEVSAYVNLTATGTAFTGACEYAGYICTVAAGNITIYDNTSAAGTVIVPTTALALGAYPIFGAGTNGKMALTTGCHVVLSGAATVNVLVQ